MVTFFSIEDNSFAHRGFPWIQHIVTGLRQFPPCDECGVESQWPVGDLQVTLEQNKGSKWPDVLGCGAHPLLIVSERVLEDWRVEHIGKFPAHRVEILQPLPKRLRGLESPQYFWIDGQQVLGAKLDFDRSGFVDVQFCFNCGRRWDDVSKTHQRQHSGVWPYTFVERTWNGTNLFTTDLSPAAFFCTSAVVECARKHRHINFRFVPVEAGDATWSKGIDYLGKQWPPYHPLRPSEGKTLDQWLEQLRNPTDRYDARVALLDLGKDAAPAVPSLIQMLDDEDDALRREAALLLKAIGKLGVPLGAKGEAAARQHEQWFQKTLGKPECHDSGDSGDAPCDGPAN